MTKRGRFITIDGPNGVGKTTIVRLACERFRVLGWSVLQTKEPTSAFNRANEEKRGPELARLIVEDRRCHLANEVEPSLRRGMYVICDRYIESSLVYRKLDGISFEATYKENSSFQIPNMSILLIAPMLTLKERLKDKKTLTRFEREHTSEEELALYEETHRFLSERGFKSVVIKNDEVAPQIVAKRIVDLIMRLV